jgi:hypothetical protein
MNPYISNQIIESNKPKWTDQDLQEFAEWCMIELRFYDACYIRGNTAYESLEDLIPIWEFETGMAGKQCPICGEYTLIKGNCKSCTDDLCSPLNFNRNEEQK